MKKLIAAGMRGRALKLIKSYLTQRSIKVTVGDKTSSLKRIYSSVPQGGKWSAPLWDFEISTLDDIDLNGLLMSYADDCSLVYRIHQANRSEIIDNVNQDLAKLESWGVEWHVSFEPSKTHSMVISRKSVANAFKANGIYFMGSTVEPVEELKLVGFIFDPRMTMKPMVDYVARKARQKLGAIKRLQQHLDSKNLEQMFKAFVRSSLEYGNLQYMSAGESIKFKLDKVQAAAERLGGFSVEPLRLRREAALIGFVFKLLDGDGRGLLNDFAPALLQPIHTKTKQTEKVEIKPRLDSRDTTKQFDRSIEGQMQQVWSKIPEELMNREAVGEWQQLTKNCQRYLTGKKLKKHTRNKKAEKLIIASAINDNRTILNNELNVKFDLDSIARELKSLGINFNKSLSTR